MKLEYFVDTGLYTNIIFVMLTKSEIPEFIETFNRSNFFEFDSVDGYRVLLSENANGNFDICIRLSNYIKSEVSRKCNILSEEAGPCHDYVDIDGIYSIMISKDEYF